MAILAFMIPVGKDADGQRRFLMEWKNIDKIPWGILLLFGGGFALASGFQASGLTKWLGQHLTGLHYFPLIGIIVIISIVTVILTEFTSNTATATTLLPIVAGLAVAMKINPLLLMIPATISSSTAFMLPVATPPNAIAFGSGYIRIKDMLRIGIMLNLIGLILLIILLYVSASPIFGIDWSTFPAWAQ